MAKDYVSVAVGRSAMEPSARLLIAPYELIFPRKGTRWAKKTLLG
jgi:hypothetical protein